MGTLYAVLLEYMRSLAVHRLEITSDLCQLAITVLVGLGEFTRLQQLAHFGVLSDVRALAPLLLDVEPIYPPAFDMALDLYKQYKNGIRDAIGELVARRKVGSILVMQWCFADRLQYILALKLAIRHEMEHKFAPDVLADAIRSSTGTPFVFHALWRFVQANGYVPHDGDTSQKSRVFTPEQWLSIRDLYKTVF